MLVETAVRPRTWRRSGIEPRAPDPVTVAGAGCLSRHKYARRRPRVKALREGDIPDAELVLRARSARRRSEREDAFRVLVQRYWKSTVLLVRARLRSTPDAEDVTQEAFVRAWRSLDNLKDPAHFLGWFLRIARNLSIDHVRRERRGDLSIEQITPVQLDSAARGLLTTDSPDEVAEQADDWLAVEKALSHLPDRYRTVLTLRYLQDLPHAEIARALGEPEGTIRNRVFRALNLLRSALRLEETRPRS